MRRRTFLELTAGALASPLRSADSARDWRNIRTGSVIPDEGYCDQPYVVITDDGNWLCTMTTGPGVEGQQGQHIVATISSDEGRSWSELIDIEPAEGPEASWVMPLKVASGRVYVFYTYNKDNLRRVNSNSEPIARRVDTLGGYMFKYSDDHGRNWSRERYEIPMRQMRIDRENTHHGEVMFFWGVGKPIIHQGAAYIGFAKVGRWGNPGTMIESQGCFLRSDNILTERDAHKIRWELLPDGEEGLRAPKGPMADEANLVALSDGSLYCTYRTIDGYNCHAYSRDGGHTWSGPEYASYSPGGRRIKHPRAANFVRKFSNGKFLLWYHNHGGEAVHRGKWNYYRERNPGWLSGGIEKDGYLHWSEPEIVLYDDDPEVRISYPDFIEADGRFFLTATQKTVARVHEIERDLLEGLWSQRDNAQLARRGLAAGVPSGRAIGGSEFEMPPLPSLAEGKGFAMDFWIRLKELSAGQTILDTRLAGGKGLAVTTSDRFTLSLTLHDGRHESQWDSDPGTHPGTLRVNHWQHAAIIVDGGPKIICFVVDGVFNDGGPVRQYGWGRFHPDTADVNGLSRVRLGPEMMGSLQSFRVYDRPLRTSEAVGNYRAGLSG